MENIKAGLQFAWEKDLNLTEIRVLLCLIEGDLTAKDIMELTDMSFTHVHKILLTLRIKQIISCKREGRFLKYQLIKNE